MKRTAPTAPTAPTTEDRKRRTLIQRLTTRQDATAEVRSEPTGLLLSDIIGNLTITRSGHVTAWYVASPQRWSFRTIADRNALITAHASRLSELTGRRLHIRVTHRPYPVARWAQELDNSVINPLPSWRQYLAEEQVKVARLPLDDKIVYYGVRVGKLTQLGRTARKLIGTAIEREIAGLQRDIGDVDRIMAGHGMDATPATASDMDWLMTRSLGLCLPAPLDLRQQPTDMWEPTDLAEWTSGIEWAAPSPYAPHIVVSGEREGQPVSRYVSVLTLGRMELPPIPEVSGPWLQRLDQLPFPYELAATIDVRVSAEAGDEIRGQLAQIRHQVRHHQEHGVEVPISLARQSAQGQVIEDETRSGPSGLNTRIRGWFRVAIAATDEERLRDRIKKVSDLYGEHITVVRPAGQYALAREFIPGEPLSTEAYKRRMPITTLAGSLPAVSAAVGDRRGFNLGFTSGTSRRPVMWHPWHAQEVRESSGLTPIVGTLGSGKTALGGDTVYNTSLMGVPWVVLDPSGPVGRICELPELRPYSKAIDLMNAEPGTLNPFRIVPDPERSHYTTDQFWQEADREAAAEAAYRRELQRAAGHRRTLAVDVLLGLLPAQIAATPETYMVVLKAAERAAATAHASPRDIIAELRRIEGSYEEHARNIADLLDSAAALPQGQLIFPAVDAGDDQYQTRHWRLVVMSLKGLSLPNAETAREDWSMEERYSVPLLYLAGWYAQRSIYARDLHERKGLWLDECHEMQRVSSGRELMRKSGRDSRKHNARVLLSTQDGEDVYASGITNWVDSVFVGRTTGQAAQRSALKLLGVEPDNGYEAMLAELSAQAHDAKDRRRNREFIYADGAGGIERITVTINRPALLNALDSTADPHKSHSASGEANPWTNSTVQSLVKGAR
ncbi:ATP-binding protein [Streptantibioticus ferralitis]|uniref:ATP-binding protein n=1 Tax=Streptantibioticus ferralitis TaxID=236510 RepID=A0ABT5ZD25_9ACTN|nr:ATP-binding protein [Streptantibioticus ferralitis]MDF2260940.1 ATP-binding protein [Streptantibioticus ferralitis]